MRQAQEAVFSERPVNPLQYGEYSRSLRGTQENPKGQIYTKEQLQAARARLHRGTAPQNHFLEGILDAVSIGGKTASYYAQPWDTGLVRTQTKAGLPINEGGDGGEAAFSKHFDPESEKFDYRGAYRDLCGSDPRPKYMTANQEKQAVLSKMGAATRDKLLPGLAGRAARRGLRDTREDAVAESVPIEEVSAKAKLAYLRRKLKRRYFKRKPTAVAFQDLVMPSDDSLTEGYTRYKDDPENAPERNLIGELNRDKHTYGRHPASDRMGDLRKRVRKNWLAAREHPKEEDRAKFRRWLDKLQGCADDVLTEGYADED